MSMFQNLTKDKLEKAEDRLGGNFDAIPTNVYTGVINNAYAGVSKGGAQKITLHVMIDGKDYRETVYITNKKGENFYPDKQDVKKRQPLPGFTAIDDICMFTTEKPLAEQSTETKQVKQYDPDLKKEVPKPAEVLIDLLEKPITLAIQRQIVDKQKMGDSGNYVNTGETRTENVIVKSFHPETGRTILEYMHEIATPEFRNEWLKLNEGKDYDKSKGGSKAAGGAGQAGTGAPGAAAGGNKHKSLFGNS